MSDEFKELIQMRIRFRESEAKAQQLQIEIDKLKEELRSQANIVDECKKLKEFAWISNKRVLYLIERLSVRKEEKFLERQRWKQLYEKVKDLGPRTKPPR